MRQPNRGATIGTIDENAIRRAAKGPVEFLRNGNFLAIIGDDETAVEAAGAAAVNHVTWQHVEAPTPTQQEANWLLQRPVVERVFGAPDPGNPQGRERYEATFSRGYLAHASISPSCGLALYKDAKLTVWTHCQGVYPVRAALSKILKLELSSIIVHHVQGSGCYGHNGADDAAADAAIIAMAYLNGHQDHFTLVGGQESARSTVHLADIFRLADKAGLLRDPDLAIARMQTVLAARGIKV